LHPFHKVVEKEVEMVYLTRRATFSASHYYWNPAWTAEKNEQVFGRCANRHGHGHNYTLEVTVAGVVDPATGFVVDLKWLKGVIEREVLEAWDHRHLNLDVPEFAAPEFAAPEFAAPELAAPDLAAKELVAPESAAPARAVLIPTTENLAIAAWRRLEPAISAAAAGVGARRASGGARLSRVRVYETPEIFAEYRGEA
jgi:6-pyruvoyltetrahydropterin/6-carboxytetrahydropterin synthase